MLKKTLAILLVILTLFISCACTYLENITSVSSDTESEVFTSELTEDTTNTVDSTADTGEVATEETDREIDIMEFINLAWNFEENDEYPYLTKDDILSFDKQAEFISPYPSHLEDDFIFYIRNANCSLFGYDCVLEYTGKIKDPATNENVTAEENAIYGTIYNYNGNGNDVLFGRFMEFTIPNITYNEFIDIQNKISEFTNNSTIRFSNHNQYVSEKLLEAADSLGADTVQNFPPVEMDVITSNSIPIPNSEWYITIKWMNEYTRENNAQYWSIYKTPLSGSIYNRLIITIRV